MSPLFFSVLAFTLFVNEIVSKPNYCLPSNSSCWPTVSEISDFSTKLAGNLLTNSSSSYMHYVNMTQDTLYINQFPSFIVLCSNVEDIEQSVLFAKTHLIQISIISTGHSYSGRCTANYSLQINLSNMRRYAINKDRNGEMQSITVETGLQWGSIYGLSAPNIVIGPDALSVGPGGSSLRGGHSPISPHYGLCSDFTLEYFIVDSNSDIVHIYNTSGINQTIDDLFWSLKGGGGSTFGVVVNITFLVHKPEPQSVITSLQCEYMFYSDPVKQTNWIGDQLFNNLFDLIKTGKLDQGWGGYLLSGVALPSSSLIININYYGNSTFAMENAEPLFHLADPYKTAGGCSNFTIYETFEEFIVTFGPQEGGGYMQLWNDLIPKENLTSEYTDTLCQFLNSSKVLEDGFVTAMCGIFQGGKVNSFPDDYTAVSPGFRHNQFEMALGTAWSDPKTTNAAIEYANKFEKQFTKFGYNEGSKYSNEENYDCDGCDWKQAFYGPHYDRLLATKQKWDPNQVFWCHHCVGSDQ